MIQNGRPERRRYRRLPLALPVRVWGTDPSGEPFFTDGTTIDLSPEGVRFTVDRAPDPTRPITVDLAPHSPDGDSGPFRLRAALDSLRLEQSSEGENRWMVAGHYQPDQCEWLRVESPSMK